MSDDINYHFPDFLLANQSKNVFAKHAVDLANKCVPLKISTAPLAVRLIKRRLKNQPSFIFGIYDFIMK